MAITANSHGEEADNAVEKPRRSEWNTGAEQIARTVFEATGAGVGRVALSQDCQGCDRRR